MNTFSLFFWVFIKQEPKMFVAIEHKLDQLFQINVPETVLSTKSHQQGFRV